MATSYTIEVQGGFDDADKKVAAAFVEDVLNFHLPREIKIMEKVYAKEPARRYPHNMAECAYMRLIMDFGHTFIEAEFSDDQSDEVRRQALQLLALINQTAATLRPVWTSKLNAAFDKIGIKRDKPKSNITFVNGDLPLTDADYEAMEDAGGRMTEAEIDALYEEDRARAEQRSADANALELEQAVDANYIACELGGDTSEK